MGKDLRQVFYPVCANWYVILPYQFYIEVLLDPGNTARLHNQASIPDFGTIDRHTHTHTHTQKLLLN